MTALPECVVLDFETYPIRQRPDYPPKPVGVAIWYPFAHTPQYHTDGQICGAVKCVWDSGLPVLCHNAAFDLAVAYEQLGMPLLPPERVHDTMFLAYLYDPHSRSLGLKELARDVLHWAPDERDELVEWILSHKAHLEQQAPWNDKVTKKAAGAWIWAAPEELVAPYALGDVKRTYGLFEHLWPIIQNEGMGEAYDRERRLMPILMENEREGICIDSEHLALDVSKYTQCFDMCEHWLRTELCASGLNFDSDRDVAAVLLERGTVPKENWSLTAAGQLSMSKETLLPRHFSGPNGAQIASVLGYRNRLKTCLDMFMRPWLAQAQNNRGRISTSWNQVRNPEGGTRTGRPSTSNPNLLNISKSFDGRPDGYLHPEFLNVPRLPLCRNYILPDEGHTFLHRDFDGQELRVFAHFEQSALRDQYLANANLDPHAFVEAELSQISPVKLDRTAVKVLNFQALYGGGAPAAQRKLGCSLAEARQYKAFHDRALPGRKHLNNCILRTVRQGRPIRTWGGRLYRPEAPTLIDGRMQSWEYKLINYLIQGSAADITKQALIDWYPLRVSTGARFLVTVYDEINISAPVESAASAMAHLRECMNADRLTVPMASSSKHGATWGAARRCKPEERCPVCA